MKFFKILVLTLCFCATVAKGQTDIEPTLIFSDTANYQFSGEWQYLSTDIYLFNGEKFTSLINELDFVRLGREQRTGFFGRRRSDLSEEYLEYLFITARLKNVKFFGDNEITYPLYNFQISRDSDERYHTYVSDNIDKIRIIDNLPLYSASDFIDAEIQVRAITNNDRDQILGMVGAQLRNLSQMKSPTQALMGIIGEFGSFIEANTQKKEYRFSSTIRLFEQKNFDTRLHSIRVYALLTKNSTPQPLNTEHISAMLDTSSMPEIDRSTIANLIDYTQYPLIVVANYKSLYRMEQVTGDEVNFANIEKRKLKIENDFRSGLINAETYRQERDFINFITIFSHLKNHLEVYNLNYKTGNIDAVSGTLFTILQYYRQLIRSHQEMQLKYRGNSTFKSVFSKEYESILEYASLYLDDDHNLRSLKELVKKLIALEQNPDNSKLNEIESTVQILRFSDLISHPNMEQSVEGQAIKTHLQNFEGTLLEEKYKPVIKGLNSTAATPTNRHATDTLRSMVRSTACIPCREEAFSAIDSFMLRLNMYQQQQALSMLDSLQNAIQPWIFAQIQYLEHAEKNLEHLFPEDRQKHTYNFIKSKLKEIERDLGDLQHFSRMNMAGKELYLIQGLIDRLKNTIKRVDKNIQMVCTLNDQLCSKLVEDSESHIVKDTLAVDELITVQPEPEQNLVDSLINELAEHITLYNGKLDSIMGLTLMEDPDNNIIDKLEIIISTQNKLIAEAEKAKQPDNINQFINRWDDIKRFMELVESTFNNLELILKESDETTTSDNTETTINDKSNQ